MSRIAGSNLINWLIVGLIAVPIGLTYWQHSDPGGAARYFDFEKCYYATAQAVLRGGASVLKSHFDDGTFMNVPIMAWLLTPLAQLSIIPADIVFAVIGVVSIAVTLLLLAGSGHRKTAPLLCLMFILNGPLWYSLLLGNSTQIVLLCLVAALTLWGRQKGYSAGLLIGIAAVIKPMLLLFGLYFVWKKSWSVVLGGATVIAGAIAGSLAIAGPDITMYWYQHCVSAFAGKPMPAYNVQSVEAFIARLSEGAENVTNWRPHILPFWGGIARDFIFLSLFATAGYSFWLGRARPLSVPIHRPSARDHLEFCVIVVLCVTTSTVSWTHYYLLLLLPYSLYLTGRLPLKDDRFTHSLIWTSLIFCSLPVRLHIFESKRV